MVVDALTAAALTFAQRGYLVALDGVVGPWFLGPWQAANDFVPVHYVVLMPSTAANLARFVGRKDHPLQEQAVVSQMWAAFDRERANWGRHMLDTSGEGPEASLAALRAGLAEGRFRL